jgi:two-component system, OmpR family, sensor kinase
MSRDRTVRASSRVPRLRRVLRPFQQLMRGWLRLRVLIAVVSVTLVVLAVFDFAAVTGLRRYLVAQTDTSLRYAALHTRPGLINLLPPFNRGASMTRREIRQMGNWISRHQFTGGPYSVLYIPKTGRAIALEDGTSASPNVPVNLPDLVVNGQVQTTTSVDRQQLRSVAIRAAGGTLVVSSGLDNVSHTLHRLRSIVLIGSTGAVLLIGLGTFWLLRRGLQPIEIMAAQADRITAGDLTDRVTPPDRHSEVGRLGAALNGMLARIETSVHEREAGQELMRQFFADASHELRNPLASLRANAELYQQGALTEPAPVDEVMRRIALEARRMSGLVDDMLRLARLDQHPRQQREPVELSDLVAGCVDRIRVAAPQRDWHTEIAAGVATVGDEELLRRAVDNLLANVLSHTPGDTAATVTLRVRRGAAEIEVSDTGPGVPAGLLPRIFDRFYRAGTTTPRPGSGLGLAIVTQIATVHDGTVAAEPNVPHGLRIRLTLPVAGLGGLTQDSHDSAAVV